MRITFMCRQSDRPIWVILKWK